MDLESLYDLVIGSLAEVAEAAGSKAQGITLDVRSATDTAGRCYSCVRATPPGIIGRLSPAVPAVTALTGKQPAGVHTASLLTWLRGPRGGEAFALPLGGSPQDGPAGVAVVLFAGEPTGAVQLGLTRMAVRLGPVLEQALASAAVYERAVRDALTGLFNHGFADSFLPTAAAGALRTRGRLAMAIFDLDHFKQVNDTYGHPAGDLVLRQFAAILSKAVRTSDVAARWGGEEFALLLPGADTTGAVRVCEAVRTAMQGNIRPREDAPPVTCSVGVAAIPEHARDVVSLVVAADGALYQAKNSGRDRVVAA